MPLTRQYLRYVADDSFGVLCSKKCNVLVAEKRVNRKYELRAIAPALENVIIWDFRREQKVCVLEGDKHEVTSLAVSSDHSTIAIGYSNGLIRIWNVTNDDCSINTTLSGHKSAVTCLVFDAAAVRLISGAKDNDVILWDVVNECGQCKLSGHKAPVTDCIIMTISNVVITSSKDGTVKLWDLDTYHCFHTLVDCHSEVWSIALVARETRLVVGSSDRQLRVWSVEHVDAQQEVGGATSRAVIGEKRAALPSDDGDEMITQNDVIAEHNRSQLPVRCTLIGSIKRDTMDRLSHVRADPSGMVLLCQNGEKSLDIYQIRSEAELEKVRQRRRKKLRKRQQQQQQPSEGDGDDVAVTITDELSLLATVKMDAKIKSFDITASRGSVHKLLVALGNNSVIAYNLNTADKPISCDHYLSLVTPAHRSDVRTVCFSSDDSCIASGSSDSVKIWSSSTHQCVCTIPSGYCLCSAFAPGDRHLLAGTKNGEIQLFSLSTSTLLESVQGHEEGKAVWSLCLQPDKRGFVTGSADHTVKFWEFELVTDNNNPSCKKLTFSHTRTLKMSEDVLCVKYSSNYKLLAVSLLDCTVKIFFADSLKFFLSLYGHKLPVLCLDISSDSTLLVTGSADKNIKFWGLDFGDCHKSIFAHDDSIMAIQFIPGTHLVFSAGKDHMVKCWDGDKFDHVMSLPGHQAEVWCMSISSDGGYLVTGSHDSSIRVWARTDEPLVLQEERENEREQEFEESVAKKNEQHVIPGEVKDEMSLAGRKSIETVKSAEQIMEAIELYKEERLKLLEYKEECKAAGKTLPPLQRNPIITAYGTSCAEQYVLQIVKRVKSSELEESLLVMPFSYMFDLLTLLNHWIKHGWEVELSCRCLFFLLRVHHSQLVSSEQLLPLMDQLRVHCKEQVTKLRDMVGFNMAGLQFLQQQLDAQGRPVFADVTEQLHKIKKKRKITTHK